jgi:hypothetical protein
MIRPPFYVAKPYQTDRVGQCACFSLFAWSLQGLFTVTHVQHAQFPAGDVPLDKAGGSPMARSVGRSYGEQSILFLLSGFQSRNERGKPKPFSRQNL